MTEISSWVKNISESAVRLESETKNSAIQRYLIRIKTYDDYLADVQKNIQLYTNLLKKTPAHISVKPGIREWLENDYQAEDLYTTARLKLLAQGVTQQRTLVLARGRFRFPLPSKKVS